MGYSNKLNCAQPLVYVGSITTAVKWPVPSCTHVLSSKGAAKLSVQLSFGCIRAAWFIFPIYMIVINSVSGQWLAVKLCNSRKLTAYVNVCQPYQPYFYVCIVGGGGGGGEETGSINKLFRVRFHLWDAACTELVKSATHQHGKIHVIRETYELKTHPTYL